jgi:hypothetical protein
VICRREFAYEAPRGKIWANMVPIVGSYKEACFGLYLSQESLITVFIQKYKAVSASGEM